jgi:hypothetical protein
MAQPISFRATDFAPNPNLVTAVRSALNATACVVCGFPGLMSVPEVEMDAQTLRALRHIVLEPARIPETNAPLVHKRCASFPDPAFRVLLGTLRSTAPPPPTDKTDIPGVTESVACLQEFHTQMLGIIAGAIDEYKNGQRDDQSGLITKRCLVCRKARPSYMFDYNRTRAPMVPGQVILPLRLSNPCVFCAHRPAQTSGVRDGPDPDYYFRAVLAQHSYDEYHALMWLQSSKTAPAPPTDDTTLEWRWVEQEAKCVVCNLLLDTADYDWRVRDGMWTWVHSHCMPDPTRRALRQRFIEEHKSIDLIHLEARRIGQLPALAESVVTALASVVYGSVLSAIEIMTFVQTKNQELTTHFDTILNAYKMWLSGGSDESKSLAVDLDVFWEMEQMRVQKKHKRTGGGGGRKRRKYFRHRRKRTTSPPPGLVGPGGVGREQNGSGGHV